MPGIPGVSKDLLRRTTRIGGSGPGGGVVGGGLPPSLPPLPGTAPGTAPAPLPPLAPVYQPPDISEVKTSAEAPKDLTDYSANYNRLLSDYEKGSSAAAKAKTEELNADIERQVAAAKQQAAGEGRPFDEAKMRAELSRGKFKSMSDEALAREAGVLGAAQGGLGILKAPGEAQREQTGLNLTGQKTLMDYWLGKGAGSRDEARLGIERSRAAQGDMSNFISLLNSLNL